MKLHYFDQEKADKDDMQLAMSMLQGYVPPTCLLGGPVVWAEVSAGRNPCWGCEGPREKCGGAARNALWNEAPPPKDLP